MSFLHDDQEKEKEKEKEIIDEENLTLDKLFQPCDGISNNQELILNNIQYQIHSTNYLINHQPITQSFFNHHDDDVINNEKEEKREEEEEENIDEKFEMFFNGKFDKTKYGLKDFKIINGNCFFGCFFKRDKTWFAFGEWDKNGPIGGYKRTWKVFHSYHNNTLMYVGSCIIIKKRKHLFNYKSFKKIGYAKLFCFPKPYHNNVYSFNGTFNSNQIIDGKCIYRISNLKKKFINRLNQIDFENIQCNFKWEGRGILKNGKLSTKNWIIKHPLDDKVISVYKGDVIFLFDIIKKKKNYNLDLMNFVPIVGKFCHNYNTLYHGKKSEFVVKYSSNNERIYCYLGDFENGWRYGKGSLFNYSNIDKTEGVYIEKYYGDWKNNKKEGYGYCLFSSGEEYEGNWIDDKRHGEGVYIVGGKLFKGDWKEGKLHCCDFDRDGSWDNVRIGHLNLQNIKIERIYNDKKYYSLDEYKPKDNLKRLYIDFDEKKVQFEIQEFLNKIKEKSVKRESFKIENENNFQNNNRFVNKLLCKQKGDLIRSEIKKLLCQEDGIICQSINEFIKHLKFYYDDPFFSIEKRKLVFPYLRNDVNDSLEMLISNIVDIIIKCDNDFSDNSHIIVTEMNDHIHRRIYDVVFPFYKVAFKEKDDILNIKMAAFKDLGIEKYMYNTTKKYLVFRCNGKYLYVKSIKILEKIYKGGSVQKKVEVLAEFRKSVLVENNCNHLFNMIQSLFEVVFCDELVEIIYKNLIDLTEKRWSKECISEIFLENISMNIIEGYFKFMKNKSDYVNKGIGKIEDELIKILGSNHFCGSDELTPLYCYCFVKSNVNCHISIYEYIKDFKPKSLNNDERLSGVLSLLAFYEGFPKLLDDTDIESFEIISSSQIIEQIEKNRSRKKIESNLIYPILSEFFLTISTNLKFERLKVTKLDNQFKRFIIEKKFSEKFFKMINDDKRTFLLLKYICLNTKTLRFVDMNIKINGDTYKTIDITIKKSLFSKKFYENLACYMIQKTNES